MNFQEYYYRKFRMKLFLMEELQARLSTEQDKNRSKAHGIRLNALRLR